MTAPAAIVRWRKQILAGVLVVTAVLTLGGCALFEKKVDDIFRILGATPGTFYNYGADGQVVVAELCHPSGPDEDVFLACAPSDM